MDQIRIEGILKTGKRHSELRYLDIGNEIIKFDFLESLLIEAFEESNQPIPNLSQGDFVSFTLKVIPKEEYEKLKNLNLTTPPFIDSSKEN